MFLYIVTRSWVANGRGDGPVAISTGAHVKADAYCRNDSGALYFSEVGTAAGEYQRWFSDLFEIHSGTGISHPDIPLK